MILFGVRAQLFEGHYGIFELTLYNTVAYTNQSYCDNVSDKLSTLFKFAQQDLGITALPHYIGLSDPRMVEIMELPAHCHRDIWILTHPDLRNTARIKAFMQFMYQSTRD